MKLLPRLIPPPDRQEPHQRSLAKLGDPHPNRRKAQMPGERNIVEAGNGDVIGHSNPGQL